MDLAQANTDLHTEIIDRQKAEMQLRELKHLRVAIESSNDGVSLFEGPSHSHHLSATENLDILGSDNLEEAQRTDRFVKIHPDDSEVVQGWARRQRGEPAPSQYRNPK